MVKHYIIMSSSYTDGTRIALDITEESLLNGGEIYKIIQQIRKECGQDVPLSTHMIEVDSKRWESIKKYDPFFEDVEPTESVREFTKRISKDRILSGMDVATYILSKFRCTHLSLEKLVYFAYADYLCKYSKTLFEDRIFAFTHGPVISSVYETYKRSGHDCLGPYKLDEESDIRAGVTEMPAKSRILFAVDGANKLRSIDETLSRYGKYSAGELVSLTHREGSPWSRVDSRKMYQLISDELIIKYHYVETAGRD